MDDGRIAAVGLVKQYQGVTAVDDLSFRVESGRVTGFLGPNGAGKTTTLRMLLNLAGYLLRAVFGVGVGALVRHQLAALRRRDIP